MRISSVIACLAVLSGCATSGERIDQQAREAGLVRTLVNGTHFQHVVYSNPAAAMGAASTLIVFLEGDGRPWNADGRTPSSDPTSRTPLALQLLAITGEPALYVSRPCYQQRFDPACSQRSWTGGRYSAEVVESLVAAIDTVRRSAGASDVVLVGYSGGGVLAVLAAERLDRVAAVATLAANLDIDSWTQHHGYLPLSESLNPARSNRAHPWLEIHFAGAQDTIVPLATADAYFARYPTARRGILERHDHTCCWLEAWPSLWLEVSEEIHTERTENTE